MRIGLRLCPILMTSLATIIGLLPILLKLDTDSESYAHPQRRSPELSVSVALTVFIVRQRICFLTGFQLRALGLGADGDTNYEEWPAQQKRLVALSNDLWALRIAFSAKGLGW